MTRPLIVDAFPFHDELDLLEMRLTELYDAVDWFILVEADVTHQDVPKPAYYLDNQERFSPFADKIIPVWATGLPKIEWYPDPWSREKAQREHIATGLATIGVTDSDIVLQSDVDEIPRALHARNVRPGGNLVRFQQTAHFWAVDWLYPDPPGWYGTVAGTVASINKFGDRKFAKMRDARGYAPSVLKDAGWHFSWLGGAERATKKVNSFCHPEVESRIRGAIDNDNFYWREGYHVDGIRMMPVTVDHTYPKWIRDGNAPKSWYRPC
jgi:beta-1,4-mannosyl-glycoprotein beta-1,4-N-acetylglucosaminyltransferase